MVVIQMSIKERIIPVPNELTVRELHSGETLVEGFFDEAEAVMWGLLFSSNLAPLIGRDYSVILRDDSKFSLFIQRLCADDLTRELHKYYCCAYYLDPSKNRYCQIKRMRQEFLM